MGVSITLQTPALSIPSTVRQRLAVWVVGGPAGHAAPYPLAGRPVQIGREVEAHELRLDDPSVSRVHATIRHEAVSDSYALVDRESSNGVYVGGARVRGACVLEPGDVIRVGDSVLVVGEIAPESDDRLDAMGLIGRGAAMTLLRQTIRRVAPSSLSVLVTGATGTGKEVVARAIHVASGRKGAFVAVNCAAFASTMVEGALFGHRKGAYTGATSDEPGAFLAADGGTLFLDEIVDMPLEIQPKLLRALENGEIMPLGASTPSRYDARVIAAAQQPISALVAEHKFRDDLYARLVGVSLDTPALRLRREDIVPLWQSFLPEPHRAYPISSDLIEALCCYDWPRNVRELRQVAERMAVLHDGEAWTLAELDAELREHLVRRRAEVHEGGSAAESDDEDKRPMPREELVALLEACQGSIAEAARRARRNRKQIYRWMDQHELPRGTGRPQR